MSTRATYEQRGPREEDLETLRGEVVRVASRRDDWAKIELLPEGAAPWDTRVVVGSLPDIKEGHHIEVKGISNQHPKFGMQFTVKISPRTYIPPTPKGVRTWLQTFKGIGPAAADKIFNHFGPEPEVVIQTLMENPNRLEDVPGLEALAKKIMPEFQREIGQGELQSILYSVGLGNSLVRKVLEAFGANAAKLIKENPYRLVGRIRGVGFESADKLAERVGITKSSPFRIRAGLIHSLELATQDGHVYLPRSTLVGQAMKILGQPMPLVSRELAAMLDPGNPSPRLVSDECGVYLNHLHTAEVLVAQTICDRLARGDLPGLPDEIYDWWREMSKMTLSEGQIAACRLALQKPVSIITGGAGVGKTTVIRAIVEMADAMGLRMAIAAPTGRAAKRAEEVTRRKAFTIHRLLGVKGDFGSNDKVTESVRVGAIVPDSKLHEIQLLILEEMSMVALPLFATVMRHLPDGVQILMVGDPNQLPSIGPGMVLGNLIESKVVPVAELKEIFRQAAGSEIIQAASSINQGDCPSFSAWGGQVRPGLFALLEEPSQSDLPRALHLALRDVLRQERIAGKRFTIDDVQVLVPQQTTDIGVKALNELLQAQLNPMGIPLKSRPHFRIDDKVMQVVNNYDMEVMNGDVGYIRGARDEEGGEVVEVEFYRGKNIETGEDDFRRVIYTKEHLSELVLAYACTFHKSQGSEYPLVFLVCHEAHAYMLNRKLMYTGVTRGKMAVIVVGTEEAMARAARNTRVEQRNTWLVKRLIAAAAARNLPHYTHGPAEEIPDPDGF